MLSNSFSLHPIIQRYSVACYVTSYVTLMRQDIIIIGNLSLHHDFFSLDDIFRFRCGDWTEEGEMGGSGLKHRDMWNEYSTSVEKPEGKQHLGGLGVGGTILFIRNIDEMGWADAAHSSVSEQGLVASFNKLVTKRTVP
jgi:hypothetical protein